MNPKWLTSRSFLVFLGSFMISYLFFRMIPSTFDGWIGQPFYWNRGGFFGSLEYSKVWYNEINGRVVAGLITAVIEQTELTRHLFNAFIFAAFVYLTNTLFNPKFQWLGIIVSVIPLLFVSNRVRSEVFFYANSNYFFPVVLFLFLVWKLAPLFQEPPEKRRIAPWIIIVVPLILTTWLEHFTAGFFAGIGILFLIYWFRYKAVSWPIFAAGCAGIAGTAFLMLSPGLPRNRAFCKGSECYQNSFEANTTFYWHELIAHHDTALHTFFFAIFGILAVLSFKSLRPKIHLVIPVLFFGLFSFIPLLFIPEKWARTGSIVIFTVASLNCFFWTAVNNQFPKIGRVLLGIGIFYLFVGTERLAFLIRRIEDVEAIRRTLIFDTRLKQISGDWDYKKILFLPAHEQYDLYGAASPTPGSFHYPLFLGYYKLHPKTKVSFAKSPDLITVNQKGLEVSVSIQHAYPSDYENVCYIDNDTKVAFPEKSQKTDLLIRITDKLPEGRYWVNCEIHDREIDQRRISTGRQFVTYPPLSAAK